MTNEAPICQTQTNINTIQDKNSSIISSELVKTTLEGLTTDENEMLARGILPSKIKEKFSEVKKTQLLPVLWEYIDRKVTISKTDRIEAYIHNGEDGYIKVKRFYLNEDSSERESVYEVMRFYGHFGPVLLIDHRFPGIKFATSYEEVKLSVDDFLTFARQKYSLNSNQVQMLKLVCDSFIREEFTNQNFEDFMRSPINVIDDRIIVDFPDGDVGQDLRQLRDFYDKTTNQKAYVLLLGWSLLAPIHFALKEKARVTIQTPLIALTGRTQGGKTAMATLFVGLGFGQEKDSFFFPYERIKTPYTLMKHLSESNLPALFDDVPSTWNFAHKDNLKSYTQTRHFGDRGRGDQTLTLYEGIRSFVETLNEDIPIDEDLALTFRLIILKFDKVDADRKDLSQWTDFVNSMSPGFMIHVFKELFNGKSIYEILNDVEKFGDSFQWINYGIDKINLLCEKFGISHFPHYEPPQIISYTSNALDIAQAFMGEWDRIITSEEESFMSDGDGSKMPVKEMKYRSKIEGEFTVESRAETQGNEAKEWRNYIYFTGGAFKTLISTQGLRVPYNNATSFINNISKDGYVRVEYEGKLVSRRIGDRVLKCFCISVPEFKEGEA